MRDSFRALPSTDAALAELDSVALRRGFAERTRMLLEAGADVGWRQVRRRRLAAVGIEASSPLLDRKMIELAASLSPAERGDNVTPKALVRRAASQRLPPTYVHAPKAVALHDHLRTRALQELGSEAWVRTALAATPQVAEWVDTAAWTRSRGKRNDARIALVAFALWHGRVRQEYGS
jgi:hypothetical protein